MLRLPTVTAVELFTTSKSDHFPLLQSEAVIPDVIRTVNLTGWLQTCHGFHVEMTLKIMGYSLQAQEQTESGSRLMYPLDGAKITVI